MHTHRRNYCGLVDNLLLLDIRLCQNIGETYAEIFTKRRQNSPSLLQTLHRFFFKNGCFSVATKLSVEEGYHIPYIYGKRCPKKAGYVDIENLREVGIKCCYTPKSSFSVGLVLECGGGGVGREDYTSPVSSTQRHNFLEGRNPASLSPFLISMIKEPLFYNHSTLSSAHFAIAQIYLGEQEVRGQT